VIGLLMGCRARPWCEHLIIRVQVSPGAVILTDDMEELVRVLFIGDDWAEDHHDVELESCASIADSLSRRVFAIVSSNSRRSGGAVIRRIRIRAPASSMRSMALSGRKRSEM